MKKIPSFNAFITSILMVLSLAAVAGADPVSLQGTAGNYYVNMPAAGTSTLSLSEDQTSFTVYDDGGAGGDNEMSDADGNYSNNASGVLVVTAPDGYLLTVSGSLYTESGYDVLKISDDESFTNILWNGSGVEVTISPISTSGNTLAFAFSSDGDSNKSGFALTVNLIDPSMLRDVQYESAENGSISGVARGLPGNTVSLDVSAAPGYYLSGISIEDEIGNQIDATVSGSTVTFTMPSVAVTVTPTFAPITFTGGGCLAPGVYFHLECSGQTCTISQQPASTPGAMDFGCWSDLATEIETQLGSNWSNIHLGSDLYLGGYNSGSDACVMSGFSALFTRQFYGGKKTVYGFCHITADGSGFLQSGVRSISEVTFVDAYVRGDSAGVLGASHDGDLSTLSNVTINGATVIGHTVGAIAGHLNPSTYGYATSMENVTVKNSTILAKPLATEDSVQAGVIAGMGYVGRSGANVTLDSNTVSADASIESGTYVSLGGIVGVMQSGNSTPPYAFKISGVKFSNAASSAAEVNIGGFAGLFVKGSYSGKQTIEKIGFEGSISGGTNVGGIFGKVNLPGIEFVLRNTYSRGTIGGSGMVGYIVGSLNASSEVVYNNYHVGSDVVVLGIGNGYNTNTWKTGSSDVFGNVRNATGVLATDGAMGHYMHSDDSQYYLDYFAYSTEQEGGGEDPVVVRLVGVVRNGIADEDDMKTDMFAALMNKNPVVQDGGTPNASEHNVWTRADGLNDNFPTFADDEHLPNHVVSIDWDGSWGLNSTQMSTLGFERWNAYFFDDDYGYYQAIYGYTDAAQHVNTEFVNKLTALVSAVERSSGADEGSLLLVDESGNDVTSLANVAFSSDQSLLIKGIQNIPVVYNYCTSQNSCESFESLTDKTFIFMSPKVDAISTNDAVPYQMLPLVVDLGGTDDAPSFTQLTFSIKLYDENDDEVNTPSNWTYHSNLWLTSEITQFVRGQNNTISKIEINYQSGYVSNLYVYTSNKPTIDVYGVDADGESKRVYSSPNTGSYVSVPYAMGLRAYDFEQKVGYELKGTYTATYEYDDGDYDIDNVVPVVENTEDHAFGSIASLLEKMISNVKVNWVIKNLTANDTVNLNNVNVAMSLAEDELATMNGPGGNLRIAADYSPINYTVNFDLKLPAEITDNSVLFFGNGWNNPKSNVTIEDGNFPKVYTTTCPSFVGWSPVDDGSVPGTYVLNESFLNSAVVDADYNTTAYGTWNSDNCTTPLTLDFSYWASVDDEDLAAFPGYVVLKQVLGEGDTISHPMVTEYDEGFPTYYTTLPEVDDTLTFIVSTAINRGYKISGIELQRTFKTGVNENTSIAFNAPEGGDTTLTINTSMLNSAGFNISFDYERFLVGFKRPTDNDAVGVTSVDYYVAEEYTAENWPDVKNYGLGDANLDMPKLYALNGCVGWSEEPSYDGEHAAYRKFDGTVAQAYVNNMVLYPVYFTPTDNPNLCGDAPTETFTVTVHGANLNGMELRQIIGATGDGDVADTVKHQFTQDQDDETL